MVFEKNHSTSDAINYSVKYVADNIELRKHVIGIFLELSKAFDTICHSKLLVKLQNYGIRGNCLELIKSCLSSRKQITKFDDVILFGVSHVASGGAGGEGRGNRMPGRSFAPWNLLTPFAL